MRYCVQYYKDFRYNSLIDEIIFPFSEGIVDIISQKKWKDNQRFIIDISNENKLSDAMPVILMCKKIHDNLSVMMTLRQSYSDSFIINDLKKANISFFYYEYAKTLDQIYGLIHLGASDVYITESAGFNLKEIGEYCHNKDVLVRVIPNIAQYTLGLSVLIPDSCKFFIRPEDTSTYDQYVDVFEIIAPVDKTSVLYEIYKNGVWDGDLNKIIAGFNNILPNASLLPHFGTARLSCQQKCMLGKCNQCIVMEELAKKFDKNEITFKIPRDKGWDNEKYLRPEFNEETMQSSETKSTENVGEDPQE